MEHGCSTAYDLNSKRPHAQYLTLFILLYLYAPRKLLYDVHCLQNSNGGKM